MFLVIKHIDGITSDCGIDADGTIQPNASNAELFATYAEANSVAMKFGGQVASEDRIFGSDEE